MAIGGISHVVHISTNVGKGCEHCQQWFDPERLAEAVNHYIAHHGYKLLHVGPETISGGGEQPWHTTVAVVGMEE
jgi:hypothetical protein